MHQFTEQLLFGIQLGSIYALIALGYTMVYGVLKLINFAHGDVYMVGAYGGLGAAFLVGTWLPSHHLYTAGLPSPIGALLVLLCAMAICAVLGLVIEQAAYRPLRTRAWIAPAVVLGAAAAYIAYSIALDANRTPGSCIAIALIVWAAIAWLLKTCQSRRSATVSPRLTALITAIGVSLLLENFTNLKSIFTPDPRFFPTIVNIPDPARHIPRSVSVLGVDISLETMLIFGLSLFLMATLTFIVTRTKVGKAIRAVSHDADAAALMGINTDRVISFTFMLGAVLAGAAGVMVTSLTGTAINPYIGVPFGLKAFVAAVIGGIGNIPGATLGGMIMGIAEIMVVAYGSYIGVPDTYRDAVAFFLLIVILLVRPAGLLGKFAPEKV